MDLNGLTLICLTIVVVVAIVCNTTTRIKQGKYNPVRYQYLLDSQRLTYELYSGKELREIFDESTRESTITEDNECSEG